MLTDFRANVILADPPLSSINTVATPASPADRQLLQADMDMEAILVQRLMATQTMVQPGGDIRTHHPTRSMSRTRSSVCPVLESSVADSTCYRGHYSDAVLSSLESQNDAEVEGISAKVKMLKDVRYPRACTPGDSNCCFETPSR